MIKIGSIEIQAIAAFDIQFNYSKIGPKSILRTKNGKGIIASRWQKQAVSIAGSGWMPEGLDSLDENTVQDIHCTAWLSTTSVSNVITIPRAFRTDDYTPQGFAFVNAEAIEVSVVLSGDVATLGTVAGASYYIVNYCPIITALIVNIDRSFDESSNTWQWSIEAEEE